MSSTRFSFYLSLFFVIALLVTACSPSARTPPAKSTSTSTNGYPPAAPTPTIGSYPAQVATQGNPYPASGTGEISLTDGLNRQVTLPGPAMKIVSLAASNTELLYEVGAGSQVIARDDFSDYPADAQALPSIGGSSGNYNLESIVALKPDLVLAAQINTAAQVKSLEDLGLTVYYLNNPTDFNGLYQNIQTVGKLTGRTTEASALVTSLQGRVKAVTDKLATITTQPKVYYELDATDPTNPYTAGPGTYIDLLIKMAGGQNIGSDLTTTYAQVSSEQVITANPDFILLGDTAYGVTVESVGQRSGWANISAVKNSQVVVFDDNTVSRPTARLVDALENIAKLIHPEAFK